MKEHAIELSNDEIFVSVDAFREGLSDRVIDLYLKRRYPERYGLVEDVID